MQWGNQQEAAIKAAGAWLRDKSGPPIFRLFGFAGTGKTTIAKEIASLADGLVLYACFTGKAALVLRKKGCDGASTIHSLIYKPVEDLETGKYEFILNRDSALARAKLLIVDEVSMVDEALARDLMSFGTRILVLGDPAQLPPVKGEGYFINGRPDAMLTEVHRQAAENPIIRLSMDVREGRRLTPGDYGEVRVASRASIAKDEMREIVLEADQMLCGMNRTRQVFNARAREVKGMVGRREPWHPVEGDRLICLRNNREKGLFNGGMWEADSVRARRDTFEIRVRSLDEPDNVPVDIEVPAAFFCGKDRDLDWKVRRNFDEFTYGEAITVHKSQGSQWDHVLLFDESFVFRDDAAKHLYTGITRAAERLTVVL